MAGGTLRRLYPQKARAAGLNRCRGLAFAGFLLSAYGDSEAFQSFRGMPLPGDPSIH